jgi:hypothetical protein
MLRERAKAIMARMTEEAAQRGIHPSTEIA